MATDRVTDMTIEELEQFIEHVIDRKQLSIVRLPKKRSVKEVLESLERNRWTPPPDSPSNLDLLREFRDL
jgi:hypothetical protein